MSLRFAKDELCYYVYLGREPVKKVKALVFKPGVPGPVWDRKIHALMVRLPYFRLATPEEIAAVEGEGRKVAASAPVKAKPAKVEPAPVAAAEPSERDTLRAQLDKLSIGYDKRWGVKQLKEQLELARPAPSSAALSEPVDREFNAVFS